MIIYNVTSKVDHSIAQVWEQWMLQEHGPQVVATGCFIKFTLLQIMDIDDTDGATYAAQYTSEDMSSYERYINLHAQQFRKEVFDKWGNRIVSFRTLMRVVN